MAVTTPPSWTSSAGTPARTAYCADHRAEAVAGGPAGELPVGVGGVGLHHHRRLAGFGLAGVDGRPQRLVAQAAAGAEVPAQRAARAHLHQLGQAAVLVDPDASWTGTPPRRCRTGCSGRRR